MELSHKEMSARGGKKTSKKYGKKHYKNMARLSHLKRGHKVIHRYIAKELDSNR